MNFLAHIYLSNNVPQIELGNFIGDFVKGSNFKSLPKDMAKGVVMHRDIDQYTDGHEITKELGFYFQEKFRRYRYIVVDMIYDYYLAKNWNSDTHTLTLHQFTERFNQHLVDYYNYLPEKVQGFVHRFIQEKRLAQYQHLHGIEEALQMMGKNTTFPYVDQKCSEIIMQHEARIEPLATRFLHDVRKEFLHS